LPKSVTDGDSGEGTRVEEGGFALPKSVTDGDSGEGTRVEEGGFKLPGSMAGGGKSGAVEKAQSEEDTGETTIQTGPSGVARVSFRLDVPELALSFTLEEGENVIGRVEEAAVRINLAGISRRHAVITVRGDKVTVRDEGSSNKTFVEDREVGQEPVELLAGDVLMFGDVKASLLRG
jgi:pSer/pThr/pTyr-binding forkhead associated (FHA) protein